MSIDQVYVPDGCPSRGGETQPRLAVSRASAQLACSLGLQELWNSKPADQSPQLKQKATPFPRPGRV